MKITLILHLYKNTKYLEKCIKSVFDQTDKNFELIIFSNGIKQQVKDILTKFDLNELKAKDIKIIHTNANFGHSVAYNYGAKQANGDFIYYFGSNVILKSNFTENLNKFIDQHKDADIISFSTSPKNVDNEGVLELENIADDFTRGAFNSTNDKIIKKEYLMKNNIHFERFKHYPLQFYMQLARYSPKWYLYMKQLVEVEPSVGFTYNVFDLHEQVYGVVEKLLEPNTYEYNHKDEVEYLILVTLLGRFLKNLFIIKPNDSTIQKIGIDKVMSVLDLNFPNWVNNKYLHNESSKRNQDFTSYLLDFKPYPFYVKRSLKKGYITDNEK